MMHVIVENTVIDQTCILIDQTDILWHIFLLSANVAATHVSHISTAAMVVMDEIVQ